MQKKIIYLFGILIVAFIGFYFYQKYRIAPELQVLQLPLQDLNGQSTDLSVYRGQKTMLCFSASWCGPCRAELKMLGELKQSTLKEVTIVVISDEDLGQVNKFADVFAFGFEWLNLKQAFSSIGINSIPTTYLMNKEGKVVHKNVGYIDWEDPSTANYLLGLMN